MRHVLGPLQGLSQLRMSLAAPGGLDFCPTQIPGATLASLSLAGVPWDVTAQDT